MLTCMAAKVVDNMDTIEISDLKEVRSAAKSLEVRVSL